VADGGGINGSRDLFGGNGLDGAVDVEAKNLRGGREGCDEQQKRSEKREKAFHEKPPVPRALSLPTPKVEQNTGTKPGHSS
jgi:hypothetical protein